MKQSRTPGFNKEGRAHDLISAISALLGAMTPPIYKQTFGIFAQRTFDGPSRLKTINIHSGATGLLIKLGV